jgi:hypothetical protein
MNAGTSSSRGSWNQSSHLVIEATLMWRIFGRTRKAQDDERCKQDEKIKHTEQQLDEMESKVRRIEQADRSEIRHRFLTMIKESLDDNS